VNSYFLEMPMAVGNDGFMKLNLSLNDEPEESIRETLPVPCSPTMKATLDELKKKCGKHKVNRLIREVLQSLIDQNKDKLEKAG